MNDRKQETVKAFWNELYQTSSYSQSLSPDVLKALDAGLRFLGDIRGKRIADLGCGGGSVSLYLAERGADVYPVDISEVIIERLRANIQRLGVRNIHPVCGDISKVSEDRKFDCVVGTMILHHIEPFGDFVRMLYDSLIPGGKAFFYENNAASRLLVWFRNNIVGKYGVPKYGDPDEFPLTPQEVDLLRAKFQVRQEFPEMYFFRLISAYLLRGRLERPFVALDDLFYRHKLLRSASYRQYLFIEKTD